MLPGTRLVCCVPPRRRPDPAVSPHRSVPPPDACLRAAATCPRRRAQEAINVLLFLGVDSHKDSLAACLVDQTGVRGHEKVLAGGQVEVLAGGQVEVPTPRCRVGWE